MKVTVIGVEASEGISNKTKREYSIGQLHVMVALAPPMDKENTSKGFMGSTMRCDPNLVRKIAHLPFPLEVEVVIEHQMRFGEREEIVKDIRPVETVRKTA